MSESPVYGNFGISIIGGGVEAENFAWFRECSGLEVRYDVLTYHEGGNNDSPYQLPGPVHYPNLVLSYGMTTLNSAMTAWLAETMTKPERKELVLTARGPGAERKWTVIEAFPVEWNGGSFSADGVEALALESLTIAHSGLKPAD